MRMGYRVPLDRWVLRIKSSPYKASSQAASMSASRIEMVVLVTRRAAGGTNSGSLLTIRADALMECGNADTPH